jgi:DNA-binding transcriptional LysR family regulator
MELMQMEMFVAMIEEGSVRGASERVLRTQPAVSIAVRKLEEDIGAALFDRSKRYQYQLTEAGEALYEYAKQMLALRKEAVSVVADLRAIRAGRLRVGANESISVNLFPHLAQAFLKRHSGIQIELRCGRSESLLVDLKDRKLDLALVSFKPQNGGLESKFVANDELVLITNPKHAFTTKHSIHIQDLGDESILAMEISQGSPWYRKIADAFLRFQVPLHLAVENAPIETIKKMVASGLGVGFVPLMSVREETARGELAVVAVDGFRLERSVWLVRRKAAHSLAAKAFVRVATSHGA